MRELLGIMAILPVAFGCENIKETTISGTVTNGGEPVSDAIVLLLESDSLEAGLYLANGSITNSNGHYEIIRVESGDYYIPAIKDENGNLQYDKGTDLFGWYGDLDTLTGLTIPKRIIVTKGNDLTDIDIDTLYITPLGTPENPITRIIVQITVSCSNNNEVGIFYPEHCIIATGLTGDSSMNVSMAVGPYAVPPEEIIFYLTSPEIGNHYLLSADPFQCRVTQTGPNTFLYNWEEQAGGDFNDVIMTVTFMGAKGW